MTRGRLRAGIVTVLAVAAVGAGSAYGIGQLVDDETAPTTAGEQTTGLSPADVEPTPTSSPQPPAVAANVADAVADGTADEEDPDEADADEPDAVVVEAEDAAPEPLLEPGDSGDEVRDLQARLRQIRWYRVDVSGDYDDITREAVAGFQEKRGLEATGVVDQETWDRLAAMTREPTEDEKHNRGGPPILQPGDTGDQVRELQARLAQIGWFTVDVTPNYGDITREAVAGFQGKRGLPATGVVDQKTWDHLVAMTREPTEDEKHNRSPEEDGSDDAVPAGLDPRCTTGRALCIDKTTQSLRWVVGGEVRMTLEVRFGSEMTPTREGAFSVGWKSRDHVSSLYDTPMPYAMFFSGGQAVHYSADFAANGYNGASHGCVNVRNKEAIASLFDQVNVGDKVIVYRS